MTTFERPAPPTARAGRAALLALADREILLELADRCLIGTDPPVMLNGPEVGTVMLQVREPVVGERFHLGEVVVSRADLVFRGAAGWSMRLGDDVDAALAAAICDAEHESGGPLAAEVEAICAETERRRADREQAEWAEVAPTEVAFEELD